MQVAPTLKAAAPTVLHGLVTGLADFISHTIHIYQYSVFPIPALDFNLQKSYLDSIPLDAKS
jgi:hypothetical protein